ncbi:MAG: hypothetical protein BAJALOKI1v1_660009 [Promethearchaeota archaeon]|nr:MAG: hypothetical protein BAJALOKI1v1_660009 [Candidatus Lokiarchaeota archaeon]
MSECLGDQLYRVGNASQLLGVSPLTVRKWMYAEKLKSLKTAGSEQRIPELEIRRIVGISNKERKTVLYSRVSSHGQKSDLATQEQVLEQHATTHGFTRVLKLRDIGSGLNGKRRNVIKLFQMVNNNEINVVIVTYKDRLTRFGFNYLESYFTSHGTRIIVLNSEEVRDPQKELVDDLIAIVTSFSGRVYGYRSHKARRIVSHFKKEVNA